MRKVCKAIQNPEAALRAYYGTGYIDNAAIRSMYGNLGSATIAKMKKQARELELEKGIPIVIPYSVNAKVAFEAWGIDVKELEKNRKKMQELGL